jgi:hypothetical protein
VKKREKQSGREYVRRRTQFIQSEIERREKELAMLRTALEILERMAKSRKGNP